MKTRKVFNTPGHAHELTFSCCRRLPLLERNRTRQWFVDALDAVRCQYELDLIAYVVMPEHAHVLLKPRRPVYHMDAIQKSLKQSVARFALDWLRVNNSAFLQHLAGERAGNRTRYHFWQPGGGYDRNIDNLDTL